MKALIKKLSYFWHRNAKSHTVIVYDVDTISAKRTFFLSNFGFYLLMLLYTLLVTASIVAIFYYTSAKKSLPGYPTADIRKALERNYLYIDSIQKEVAIKDNYIANFVSIIQAPSSYDILEYWQQSTRFDSVMRSKLIANKPTEEIENPYNFVLPSVEMTVLDKIAFFTPAKGVLSQNFNGSKMHFGIDIVGEEGENIYSVLPGHVISADWTEKYGFVTIIQHPYGLVSIYKHNSLLTAKEGELVNAGSLIAQMGNTGEMTTGPHLHFELWYNGIPINPIPYLNLEK